MPRHEEMIRARHRVTCDRCGVVRVSRTYGRDERYSVAPQHTRELVAEGWRVYASRSERTYCPDCGPARGHRMELIAGDER